MTRAVSLGFSVEALLPAARHGGPLRMGLSRIGDGEWLDPAPDRAARTEAFDTCPDAVQVLSGAEMAAAEVARLIGATDFAAAARAVHEDLCLVLPLAPGEPPVLAAAALAWPTDWRLADKLGLPLAAVHAPIHGYAEQLSAGVDHFVATVKRDQIFGRANWFVVASDERRYRPGDTPEQRFAHVTAANAGSTLFVRCERQTLRLLPESGAVLFTIGIYVEPLGALSPDAVRRIADATASTGEGEHERRAAPFYSAALSVYAAARGAGPLERAA